MKYYVVAALSIASFLWCLPGTSAAQGSDSAAKPASSTNTNTFVPPKSEDEKREVILRDFIERSDEKILRDIASKFKLPGADKASLSELRTNLSRYLGLVRLIRDSRKKAQIVVKDVFRNFDLGKDFVIRADEGVYVRRKTDPESGLITIRGEEGNLYVRFKKQLVSANLIRLDRKRKELFGEGNAMIREGDRVIVGDKFYFNAETKYGVVYNAQTYIKPYYYFGDKIKKIGERAYVLEGGWFSTCDAPSPHYKFAVSKAWLYQDIRLIALDVTYKVSDYPVFWFPFLFHPIKGTGFWTGLGRDTRVGWFMQVENIGGFFHLPFRLTFDYYQRLGVASLFSKNWKGKNWGLDTEGGIAYDKPLDKDNSGRWVNTVDGNNNPNDNTGIYGDWKREFRYRFDAKLHWTVFHDEKNKKLGSTRISGNFDLISDAFFKSDFDSRRVMKIDIEKVYRQDEVNFFNAGSPQSRNWNLAITDKRGGSSLSLTAGWTWIPEQNKDARNIYANDYYKYRLSQVILPKLSYSFGGTLLSTTDTKTTNTAATATNARATTARKSDSLDILDLDEAANQRREAKKRLVNFNLKYSAGISFDQTKRYDSEDILIEQKYNRVFNLSLPSDFSVGSVLRTSLRLGLRDSDVWGNTTTAAQAQGYTNASYTSIDESFSLSLGHTFNKGKLTEFGASVSGSHSLSYKIGGAESETDPYQDLRSHKVSVSGSVNFFKTTIRTGTSYDLTVLKNETRGWGVDRFGSLPISLSFSPIPGLSISDNFNYIIKTGKAANNSLSLSLRIPDFRLPFIEKVSGFGISVSWSHNYNDLRSSSLGFTLSFQTEISDMWKATFSMNTRNKELYLYSERSAQAYGKQPRNFFQDLLYSFMFWDVEKLKETRFNIQSLNFSLIHDLHEWQLKLDTSARQVLNTLGRKFTYFDFTFVFSISMKQNIGLSFPEQRYRYTADGEGKYYGKLN